MIRPFPWLASHESLNGHRSGGLLFIGLFSFTTHLKKRIVRCSSSVLTTLTAFTALLGRWPARIATLCLVQRSLAVLHEHNLLQSTDAPSHCKAVLMLQDAFVQQADAARNRAAARSGPACAGRATLALAAGTADLELGEPVQLAASRATLVCSTGARSQGRIPSVCSHVAHAVPASLSPTQTLQATRCLFPPLSSASCPRTVTAAHAAAVFRIVHPRPTRATQSTLRAPWFLTLARACQSCTSIAGPVKKCIPFPCPPEPVCQSPGARLESLIAPRRASWVASADACSTRAVIHFACSLFANSIPISN